MYFLNLDCSVVYISPPEDATVVVKREGTRQIKEKVNKSKTTNKIKI